VILNTSATSGTFKYSFCSSIFTSVYL
jgi:hypothetical protein